MEAALYRDGASRIIVQPRVLARTETVRRYLVDDGERRDVPPEIDDAEVAPSDPQKENLRFWKAVLHDYSFSDVDVEIPTHSKESVIWVKVGGSGFGDYGDYGLSFAAYL